MLHSASVPIITSISSFNSNIHLLSKWKNKISKWNSWLPKCKNKISKWNSCYCWTYAFMLSSSIKTTSKTKQKIEKLFSYKQFHFLWSQIIIDNCTQNFFYHW